MRAVDAGARLQLTSAYVALAPLGDTLDALSLLSIPQHLALLASLALVYAAWRRHRRARRPAPLGEAARALAALAPLLALYAYGMAGPRPMAALAVADPDVVVIDFHSHTSASHDARRGWSAADNRAWHRAAGFHVAWVTDHKRIEGADAAGRTNPPRAGDALVSLPGLEVVYRDEHLNILDGAAARRAAANDGRVVGAGLEEAPTPDSLAPVLLQTIPERLDRVPRPAPRQLAVQAIELSDGAPRGITQRQRERRRILHIADSLRLAVVAGSNNHGWGRTAIAWSLMTIPGWRALPPAVLADTIQQRIRTERRHAVRVLERRGPDADGSWLRVAATLPLLAWNVLTTMSWPERLSWIAWTWLLAGALARRRHRDRWGA